MSRLVVCKTQLKNVNPSIAMKAMEWVAQDIGGRIVYEVYDYYKSGKKVLAGVIHDTIRGGVGVNEKGELIYDPFLTNKRQIEAVQKLFLKYYNTAAAQAALQRLGYRVETVKRENKIFIRGMSYA